MRGQSLLCIAVLMVIGPRTVAEHQSARGTARQETNASKELVSKIQEIVRNGEREPDPEAPRLTPLTQEELNLFLETRAHLPEGVTDPRVALGAGGRVVARATVDLEAVRDRHAGGWLDPTSYLRGRLLVEATAVVRSDQGVGRVDVERVEVSGVAMPRVLLRELVRAYSKSPEYPDGFELDQPFPLPYGIQEIRIDGRQAVIVQ